LVSRFFNRETFPTGLPSCSSFFPSQRGKSPSLPPTVFSCSLESFPLSPPRSPDWRILRCDLLKRKFSPPTMSSRFVVVETRSFLSLSLAIYAFAPTTLFFFPVPFFLHLSTEGEFFYGVFSVKHYVSPQVGGQKGSLLTLFLYPLIGRISRRPPNSLSPRLSRPQCAGTILFPFAFSMALYSSEWRHNSSLRALSWRVPV